MKILSADTALGKASVCIYCSESGIIAEEFLNEYSKQAEQLLSLLNKCLNKANLSYNDIDVYSACIGPGSFTGIRIGMSALKGLAFAKQKPFIGVTSLEAMQNKSGEDIISCAIGAGRQQVYLQNFPSGEGFAVNFDDLKNNLKEKLICNCFDDIKDYIDEASFAVKDDVVYDASNIAIVSSQLVNEKLNYRNSPVYLRAPDAKESNIKRKVIFST